ncbi:MAG: hypothetical protein COX57_00710 [Alphaproteobacteria bacterium CG_4_10_14_0_2_um_filter_63_37]|nr:MAG: hypothetical protein COX57_00710 [Alphaproteobacteria bacterium CG_4_10_14_0_2_um_filter_63_37]
MILNPRRIAAVANKEWRHMLRDSRSLALIIIMPVMLLFFFGYAISLDLKDAPIGVVIEDGDQVSRDLAARLEGAKTFEVARYPSRQDLEAAMHSEKLWAGVIVPHNFARDLQNGHAQVQLLLDGNDANTARLLRQFVELLLTSYAAEVAPAAAIDLRPRVWFNEAADSRTAILPGTIVLVMAVIGALMTSLTVAREKEQGTLDLLRTTPLTRVEFVAGKLVPYFVIGMVDVAIAVAATVWLFDVPLRGSFAGLISVSAIFMVVVMLQGLLISIVTGQQMAAAEVALVSTFLPAFLLSGFIFAIANMPKVLQWLTVILPPRHFVTLTKAIFLKGLSPLALWWETAMLAGLGLVLLLAVLKQAKRLGLAG